MLANYQQLFNAEEFSEAAIFDLRVEGAKTINGRLNNDSNSQVLPVIKPEPMLASDLTLWQNRFQEVMFRPETKTPDRLQFQDFIAPTSKIKLDLTEIPASTIILQMQRPAEGKSIYLDVALAPNSHKQIFIFEIAGQDLPEIQSAHHSSYCYFDVPDDAGLKVVYIHPLYIGSDQRALALQAMSGPKEGNYCLYRSHLGQNANFSYTSINFSDSLYEFGLQDLDASHATVDMASALYVEPNTEQYVQTKVICRYDNATSHIQNHGVVTENAKGTMISVSDIKKGAHGTNAREENRFITIDPSAKAFADPYLLIDEYDVAASHLATVGQLDEETTYYLCSRGLTKIEATRLATIGFLVPIIQRIEQEELRQHLIDLLTNKVSDNQ